LKEERKIYHAERGYEEDDEVVRSRMKSDKEEKCEKKSGLWCDYDDVVVVTHIMWMQP